MGGRIEYGFAEREQSFWCAKRVKTANRMLCGRRKGWMPPVPHPFVPPNLCPDCRKVIDAGMFASTPDEQAEGTCPVCVGRAPLDEAGMVGAHLQWSWQGGRLVVTGQGCSGEGERPEYET